MSKLGHVPKSLGLMEGIPLEKATLAVETDLTTNAQTYMVQLSYKGGMSSSVTLSRFISDALDKGCELSLKEFAELNRLTGVMDTGRTSGKNVSDLHKTQKPTRSSSAQAQ